jgi:choice-of-anchor A domain-containing protein
MAALGSFRRPVAWALGLGGIVAGCGSSSNLGRSGTQGTGGLTYADGGAGAYTGVAGFNQGGSSSASAGNVTGGTAAGRNPGGGTTSGGTAQAGGTTPTGGLGTGGVCPLGNEHCPCYGNNTCNLGLTCTSQLCVNLPGTGGANTGGAASGGGMGTGDGSIDCPIGETLCGSGCADLIADNANCGACGVVCSAAHGSASCVNGLCTIVCNRGYGDCDQNAANGCEVLLTTDVNNCGGCGKACYPGVPCISSYCQIPPGRPDSGIPPSCIPTWFKPQINMLVLHDANVSDGTTHGMLWVGGNLTGVGYDVGANLPVDPTCLRYGLAVGGNINLSGTLVLHEGAAAYGGSVSVAGVVGPVCGLFQAPADLPNFTQIAADVEDTSAYLAGLPATGTVSGTTLSSDKVTCKIVVFNTTLCDFADVTISLPAGGNAVVNSTCITPTFSHGQTTVIMGGVTQPQCVGSQGAGHACDRVLYNFPDATTVTVSGMSVQGSILAPSAKFLGTGGSVAGEVIVDSLDTGDAFDAWFLEGCLDTTTC